MPTYEMPLLLRIMKQEEITATLKRTATSIFNTGGFIRKIENWGVKQLPCKASVHGHVYREANHFWINFDAPPKYITNILEECGRDIDIIRLNIYKPFVPIRDKTKCTFHEEMLPPAYRPGVQKLLNIASKQKSKDKFQYNSGLDYYPFTR